MDGAEGLAALQASVGRAPGAPPPPSLVLTDMQMPRMNGLEMARLFRQWCACPFHALHCTALHGLQRTHRTDSTWMRGRERETQPAGLRLFIAALTANVLDCVAEECAAAGIDMHLSKPLRPDDIPQLWAHASAATRT